MEITPVEILEEILAYSLPPVNQRQAPWRATLALVCYRWNAVVQETPIIWSKISCSDTLSQVKKSLAKSNTHPIDVFGSWSNGETYLGKGTLVEIRSFIGLVNCHMGRWRHVTLELFSNIPLGPSAPLLEYLEVYHGADSLAGKPVSLFPAACTPRLREVCIHGLELANLNMPFPPTISKLTIMGSKRWFLSFSSKLITVLISCPGLAVLELSSYHDDSIGGGDWETHPLVELPALRELTLWKTGKQVIRAILHFLQLPPECVVRLFSWLGPANPSAYLTSTLADQLHDLRSGAINQITFIIEPFHFVMRAQGPRWNIEVEVSGFCAVRDIVLLFNPQGTTCAEGLSHDRIPVTLEFSRDIRAEWILCRLPSISNLGCIASLKVDASKGAHLAVLSHLARPVINEGAIPIWPLPGLRELRIEGPMVKIDPVIKFVEERRGKGDRLRIPAPLQRIEVAGRDLSPSGPTKQARPKSLLDLLNLLDSGAQVIWYGERVH